MELTAQQKQLLLAAQQRELTEHHIYLQLAQRLTDQHNKQIVEQIAADEKEHYQFWEKLTGQQLQPQRGKIAWYGFIARLFGLTFSVRLMERGEKQAQQHYQEIFTFVPEAKRIIEDEDRHEQQLIDLIAERRVVYMSSTVLGLNDALVELTGALAGLTLALQNSNLIALAGLITGIAASMSMAASEYLSTKTEQSDEKNPVTAAIYTGIAYIITVFLLVAPYLIFSSVFVSLAVTLAIAAVIILFFSFYASVIQNDSFAHRFGEMILLSFGVAALSFGIGYVLRYFFQIEI